MADEAAEVPSKTVAKDETDAPAAAAAAATPTTAEAPKTSLLAVGTTNKCKLAAVQSACSKMGKLLANYGVSSHKVKSNVKDQPDSLEETIEGAQHRVIFKLEKFVLIVVT